MNSSGFTIEPTVYVDENGIEQVSYDNPVITDHSHKMAAIQEMQDEQQYYIQQDQYGNTSHVYDHGENGQQWDADDTYQNFNPTEDEYEEEDDDEDTEVDDDFYEYLMEQLGGESVYDELIEFAGNGGISDQEVEEFNFIMDSGNQEAIVAALNVLIELYNDAEDEDDEY